MPRAASARIFSLRRPVSALMWIPNCASTLSTVVSEQPTCAAISLILGVNAVARQMDVTDRVLLAYQFTDAYSKRAHDRMVDGGKVGGQTAGRSRPIGGGPPVHPPIDADERGRAREQLAAKVGVSGRSLQRVIPLPEREVDALRRCRAQQKGAGLPNGPTGPLGAWAIAPGHLSHTYPASGVPMVAGATRKPLGQLAQGFPPKSEATRA